MGREDDRRTLGHLGKIVDEDRSALTQTVDDRAVVHDLVPDIDGRAVDGKRTLNDRDGARDAAQKPRGWARRTFMTVISS